MHNDSKAPEKAKDFKGVMKKLIKKLKDFKVLIIVAVVLAIFGSVLSLISPNKLSDLTDEIAKGLVVDTKNMQVITKSITKNFDEQTMGKKAQSIMMSNAISNEDKISFTNTMSKMKNEKDRNKQMNYIVSLPSDIKKILFPTFKLENIKITSSDQIKYLEIMGGLNKSSNTKTLYSSIDKLPKNIKKLLEPTINFDTIKNIALFLIVIYILSAIFNYIQAISMTYVSNGFAKKLRTQVSHKINKLPLKYFDKHQTGDILSRVTNDIDTIAQSLNQSLSTLVSSLTLFFGAIIMMFYTNWIMALTAIFASLFGFAFMSVILSKSQKYFNARQIELGKLNGHIEEIYSGLNVVKAYNGKQDSDEKFDKYNKSVYEANRKSQFLSGLMMPLMGFIGNFGYVAVCIVGALLVHEDIITFGVIVAFMVYVRLFSNPLSQIAQSLTSLQSTAAASERVFEFIGEEEMTEETQKNYLSKDKVKGYIEFDHVNFGYDEDKTIINDFTASVKPGQKIAIVGPTGAGKTTMVNLLMKFYEINKGDIKIDGISTKELTRENIHELFTMVLQDTWMFNGTVKENIKYNNNDITDEQIKEVCSIIGAGHFIKTLPKGYDSMLGDNDSVSSGEKQLLTIARGMLENAPFLILDEATSNVDTRTEELVSKAMDKLMKNKTSFVIAHRLSTIKNADLILLMKDGNIVEQGTHNELMKQKGQYAELYNSQFLKINS